MTQWPGTASNLFIRLIFLPRLGILTASLDFYSEGENLIKSIEPRYVDVVGMKVRTVKWNKLC